MVSAEAMRVIALAVVALAGCSPALLLPTAPGSNAVASAKPRCDEQSRRMPDRLLGYVGCMVASGYSVTVNPLGGGLGMPSAVMTIGHPGIAADRALADLLACREEARTSIGAGRRILVGMVPLAADAAGQAPGAVFRRCATARGYDVSE